jgi:hypothetical protein
MVVFLRQAFSHRNFDGSKYGDIINGQPQNILKEKLYKKIHFTWRVTFAFKHSRLLLNSIQKFFLRIFARKILHQFQFPMISNAKKMEFNKKEFILNENRKFEWSWRAWFQVNFHFLFCRWWNFFLCGKLNIRSSYLRLDSHAITLILILIWNE